MGAWVELKATTRRPGNRRDHGMPEPMSLTPLPALPPWQAAPLVAEKREQLTPAGAHPAAVYSPNRRSVAMLPEEIQDAPGPHELHRLQAVTCCSFLLRCRRCSGSPSLQETPLRRISDIALRNALFLRCSPVARC